MTPVPPGGGSRDGRRPHARTGSRAGSLAGSLTGCLLAVALGSGGAAAQPAGGGSSPATPAPSPRTSSPPFQVRAGVNPAIAELGQRVVYQALVTGGPPATARWLPADTSATFTWGVPTVLRRDWGRRRKVDPTVRHNIGASSNTLFVEIPLQAFALGRLTVPGVRVEIDDGRGPRIYRLPVVTLQILPTLTAADSNADYRELHGPLAAPWWERVPWTWVVLGLLAVATGIVLIRWWRRRRRGVEAPVPAVLPPDPRAEALAALAALRALHLPEHGRFAEHAFQLGRILRGFLESTTGITRPGDTTPELVVHLGAAGLETDDLTRLSGLLRVWDRIKFAREPFTLDEAVRAERAIEMFLRRPSAPVEKVA